MVSKSLCTGPASLSKLKPARRNINILPHTNLLLPLARDMLHPHLLAMLRLKFTYEDRIPQLARYTQVLAAPHQGVGLAALRRCWDTLGIEVGLFAARY